MGTVDLSRAAANPAKRYRGARMQMGRVLTEDDFNDNERIHDEMDRRVLLDVIGATGTPDDGFMITTPTIDPVNNEIDFIIKAGALYLGGHRLEAQVDERFQLQSDWLQQGAADRPGPPGTGQRFDLVWVEAIDQEVTAVEDSELYEVALDTGDTSARTRVMRRIRVLEGISSENCHDGWAELLADLTAEGTITDELELVPDSTLEVDYEMPTNPGDLCSPSGEEGYRGAVNQAIRVQLIDANTFTWGFDNASPLYRVTVSVDPDPPGGRRLVTLEKHPRDHAHWPLAGQVVELLAWSAVLPNGEKVAERSGFLTTVATSFNPDSGELRLTDVVPPTFGAAWKDRADARDLGTEYFYMRVWDRGDDTSLPAVPFALGTAESLPHTGLTITLAGSQLRSEDHWIAAARPATPTQVVPWDLEDGRAPHGYRRWIAPLGVIQWTAGSTTGTVVDDCRQSFPPLTRVRSCCTYTVGDGLSSHGQFDSIQAAIDALPPGGGEVCILAGHYEQRFEIRNRVLVTVHGCGRRTVIEPPDHSNDSVITITDSRSITIASLTIDAPSVVGVLARSRKGEGTLRDIELRQLTINAARRSAIQCRNVSGLRVFENEVRLQPLDRDFGAAGVGTEAAMFAQGTNLVFERNHLHLVNDAGRLRTPLGGIQIGGGSVGVEIRRNRIEGGNGNGVTLGSAVLVRHAVGHESILKSIDHSTPAPWIVVVDANGCIHIRPGDPSDPDPDDDHDGGVIIVSEGPVKHVRIVDNQIRLMGSNGISSLPFIRRSFGSVTISDLRIESNRIVENLGIELPTSIALLAQGFGGVSLQKVDGLRLVENRITDNGSDFDHPVCGVFVARARDVIAHDNHILSNGRKPKESRRGVRGGLVLGGVSEMLADDAPAPSARINDNVVLSPSGPALLLIGRGAFSIEHNAFGTTGIASVGAEDSDQLKGLIDRISGAQSDESAELGSGSTLTFMIGLIFALVIQKLGGAAVLVLNTGKEASLARKAVAVGSLSSSFGSYAEVESGLARATDDRGYGPILFHDNQVTLQLTDRDATRSAILLSTLDDVSMQDNQSVCDTAGPLFCNAAVAGWSTRVIGNRFRERPGHTNFSAVTIGVMNTTAHNQATHCLRVVGVMKVEQPNQIHLEALTGWSCDELTGEFPDNWIIGEMPRFGINNP
jgi:hypothetical protein